MKKLLACHPVLASAFSHVKAYARLGGFGVVFAALVACTTNVAAPGTNGGTAADAGHTPDEDTGSQHTGVEDSGAKNGPTSDSGVATDTGPATDTGSAASDSGTLPAFDSGPTMEDSGALDSSLADTATTPSPDAGLCQNLAGTWVVSGTCGPSLCVITQSGCATNFACSGASSYTGTVSGDDVTYTGQTSSGAPGTCQATTNGVTLTGTCTVEGLTCSVTATKE